MSAVEKQCPLLIFTEIEAPKESELKKLLESKNDEDKIAGIKRIIYHILQGYVYICCFLAYFVVFFLSLLFCGCVFHFFLACFFVSLCLSCTRSFFVVVS
jgi:hypothetical protein